MADASNIYSDKYLAGHISAICYRVFAFPDDSRINGRREEQQDSDSHPRSSLTPNFENATHSDFAEPSDSIGPPSPKRRRQPSFDDKHARATIRKAETSLRYLNIEKETGLYAAASKTGFQLWVYKLVMEEGEATDIEVAIKDSELSDFVIRELVPSKEGVYRQPFTYCMKENPNTTATGPYGPLCQAITNKCLDTLIINSFRKNSSKYSDTSNPSSYKPNATFSNLKEEKYSQTQKSNSNHPGSEHIKWQHRRSHRYEHFGENIVIDNHSGNLTRIVPYLQINGTLYFRITTQHCELSVVSQHFIPSSGTVLLIMPLGIKAEVVPWKSYSDVIVKPTSAFISEFFNLFRSYYLSNVLLESLLSGWWIRLLGRDRRVFVWPVTWTKDGPSVDTNQPILYETSMYSLISKLKNPYDTLSKQMLAMHEQRESETSTQSSSAEDSDGAEVSTEPDPEIVFSHSISDYDSHDSKSNKPIDKNVKEYNKVIPQIINLQRFLHPPQEPPPSPHAVSTFLSHENQNFQPTPVSSLGSPVYSPDQFDIFDHQLQESMAAGESMRDPSIDQRVYTLPEFYAQAPHDPAEKNDSVNSVDIVEPIELEPRIMKEEELEKQKEEHHVESSPMNFIVPGASPTQVSNISLSNVTSDDKDNSVNDTDSKYRFAMVNLGSERLDSKYSSGGRYFTSVSSDSESNGNAANSNPGSKELVLSPFKKEIEPVLSTHNFENINHSSLDYNALFSNGGSSPSGSECDSEAEEDIFQQNGRVLSNIASYGCGLRARRRGRKIELISDEEQLSLQYIDPEFAGFTGNFSAKLDLGNFRLLIPQIVFDRDYLKCLTEHVLFTAPLYTPELELIELLKPLYNKIKPCHLNPDSGDSNSVPKLQFLNPPLVSVIIGEERMRARITILKFWQLLKLKPEPEQKCNITVVLMAVDMPIVLSECRKFTRSLKEAYEDCNFGEMTLLNLEDIQDGVYPVPVQNKKSYLGTLSDCFEKASMCLYILLHSDMLSADTNLLVLTWYPSSKHMYTLVSNQVPNQLARGFRSIKNEFENAEWVLFDLNAMISEINGLVCTDYDYLLLSLLVYTRFHEFGNLCAITGLIPQTMGFQYKSAPSKYLLEEEPVLHVSYLIKNKCYVLIAITDQKTTKQHIDIFKIDEIPDEDEPIHQNAQFRPIVNAQNHSGSNSNKFDDRMISEIYSRAAKMGPNHRLIFTRCHSMDHDERLAWARFTESHSNTPFLLFDVPYVRGIRVSPEVALKFRQEDPKAIVPTDRHGRLMNSICLNEDEEIHGVSINGPEMALASGVLMQLIRNEKDYYMFEIRLLSQCGSEIAPRSSVNRVLGQLRRLTSISDITGAAPKPSLIPWHVLALAKLESAMNKLNVV